MQELEKLERKAKQVNELAQEFREMTEVLTGHPAGAQLDAISVYKIARKAAEMTAINHVEKLMAERFADDNAKQDN